MWLLYIHAWLIAWKTRVIWEEIRSVAYFSSLVCCFIWDTPIELSRLDVFSYCIFVCTLCCKIHDLLPWINDLNGKKEATVRMKLCSIIASSITWSLNIISHTPKQYNLYNPLSVTKVWTEQMWITSNQFGPMCIKCNVTCITECTIRVFI